MQPGARIALFEASLSLFESINNSSTFARIASVAKIRTPGEPHSLKHVRERRRTGIGHKVQLDYRVAKESCRWKEAPNDQSISEEDCR